MAKKGTLLASLTTSKIKTIPYPLLLTKDMRSVTASLAWPRFSTISYFMGIGANIG